jgi:hypothetical protein
MHFRTYRPASPLAGFVDYIWAYNGFDSPKLKERIFPTGTFEIVFNLQRDALRISQSLGSEPRRFSGAVVSGPYEAGFFTETTEEAAVSPDAMQQFEAGSPSCFGCWITE